LRTSQVQGRRHELVDVDIERLVARLKLMRMLDTPDSLGIYLEPDSLELKATLADYLIKAGVYDRMAAERKKVAKKFRCPALKLTTRDIPNYDQLMRYRIKILKKEKIELRL